MAWWENSIREVLLDEREISHGVTRLADLITADYQGKSPLLVCVLRGAAVFHADLVRRINLPVTIDFLCVSSYGASTATSGEVRLVKDLETGVSGKDVILVEDIVDTGLSMDYLVRVLSERMPASLSTCSLLSKIGRRRVDVPIRYLGFGIPDRFVVGYGLDHAQRYRNLPFVAELRPDA